MIVLRNISLRIGAQHLLDDVNLTLHAGQKVGVIGRNGAGKSSLFRLLMAELSQDGGDLDYPATLRKAWMRQEVAGSERTALDYVLDGHEEFRRIERALAEAEEREAYERMAELHGQLEVIHGYTLRNQAEQLLSGLGFGADEFGNSVASFSGGWRIRLNLAQALMQPSDLLLLDEPTNHLDLEATLWLQQWLQQYQGTLLLISHDREFLDGVVGHILSFEELDLVLYRGNYSAYETQKAERLAQRQAAYEKQQQRIEEIENFVRRFRAKASKARQAQSRLKELDRMSRIAPAHIDSPFQFGFLAPEKLPERLLGIDELSIGYEAPLLSGMRLNIDADTRIGLLGANGQGKSTLLKVLAGQLAPLAGEMHASDYLKLGYMAQHHIDTLDLEASPLRLLSRLDSDISEQEARDFLGRFDFKNDRVTENIRHFSGGEKARLALALLIRQRPNLLLLDEPTNHLDLEMRQALTLALQEFDGALLLVSHDRYLMNNAVDDFMLVKDGKLSHFAGDLHEYERLIQQIDTPLQTSAATGDTVQDKKLARQQAAAQRQKLKPLKQKLEKVERALEKRQQRCQALEALLADSALYEEAQKPRLHGLLQEKGALDAELAALEEEWLQLSEILEAANREQDPFLHHSA